MITQTPPLGFSITSALKTAAKSTYHAAQDPRVQGLVAAAGQAYAPGATSQVMQVASRAQAEIRRARTFWYGGKKIVVQPGMAPPPGATEMPPPDEGPPPGPPVKSHMLLYAGVGAGLLVLILLSKR